MRYLLLFLLLATDCCSARSIRAWTYQEMFDEADFVFIANARQQTDMPGATIPDELPRRGIAVIPYRVDFEVLGVLKGHRKQNISIILYRFKDKLVPPNAPSFPSIDISQSNRYLVFLKDGRPLSGEIDPIISFQRIDATNP